MSQTRTSRYKTALACATEPMTVRQICDAASIPPEEAKFVSSGLTQEVKKGRAEKVGRIECPVTKHQSMAFRLLPTIKEPKVQALKAVTDDMIPDPVSRKSKKIKAI